jgi:hypothetical protein
MLTHKSVYILILLVLVLTGLCAGQQASNAQPLSVEEIVKLSKDGFSEDVIIAKIKKYGKPFDLNADEMGELRRLGVSENVIKTLIDPSQPYVPPPKPEPPAAAPAPKPAAPTKKYPSDAFAPRVPPEPGLYRFDRETPVPIDLKLFMGSKQGPGLGKVLMKKGRVMGYLAGSSARTRVKDVAAPFYLRMPDGKGVEEVVLVSLDQKKDRRELDMGPAAPKPELKPETIRQFDSLEVGAGLFRLTPAKPLDKGEYAFFLIGTAEPPKGNYGKGYDFGVEPPAAERKR